MSPLKPYSCVSARSVRAPYLSFRILFVLAGVSLSLPAFAAEGTDVSEDELYSDDVTLTTVDGAPLDINGDGFTDLAVASNFAGSDNASRYYLGNNDGSFDAPVLLRPGISSEIVAADLNGDTFIDLVQGRRDEPSVFYLGNGAGGLGAEIEVSPDEEDRVLAVAVGDLDIDGDLDLVTGTGHPGGEPGDPSTLQQNRFYLNSLMQAGGTPAFAGEDISADADDTRSIALADMDGDGDLDVIAGNDETTPGSNRIYMNQFFESGTNTVSFGAGIDFGPENDQTSKILIGDLDDDGLPDIVVLNFVEPGFSAGTNRFFLNDTMAGVFALGEATDVSDDVDHTSGGALADFDGDGDLDIAVSNLLPPGAEQSARNRLYLNQFVENGDGTVTFIGSDISTDEHQSRELAAGNIDGDDHIDIVVGNEPVDEAPGRDRIYLNNGTAEPFADSNNPPEFTSTPVAEATEGASYTYEATASDPDSGASLTITAPTLPAWLTLTDNGDGTATLSGTPAEGDVGEHEVSLEVSDGTDTAAQDFTITVEAAQDAPPPPGGGNDDDSGGGSMGLGSLLALAAYAAARRRRRKR